MMFRGERGNGPLGYQVKVYRNDELLSADRSLKVRNHSPNGFEWGYAGSGPAQLALALLLEVVSKERAERWYQRFKFEHVVRFGEKWQMDSTEIRDWVYRAELGERTGSLLD